jgi:hypothetical protein
MGSLLPPPGLESPKYKGTGKRERETKKKSKSLYSIVITANL